jgi:hypothetical protein
MASAWLRIGHTPTSRRVGDTMVQDQGRLSLGVLATIVMLLMMAAASGAVAMTWVWRSLVLMVGM